MGKGGSFQTEKVTTWFHQQVSLSLNIRKLNSKNRTWIAWCWWLRAKWVFWSECSFLWHDFFSHVSTLCYKFLYNNIFSLHVAGWFSKYFTMDYVYLMIRANMRNTDIIIVFLSQMGYLRLKYISKVAEDSISCKVRTEKRKNFRCGNSRLGKWNRLPKVS